MAVRPPKPSAWFPFELASVIFLVPKQAIPLGVVLIHWNRNDRKVVSKINTNLSGKWSILPNQWMWYIFSGNSSDSSVIFHSA
ncbi:hypothetical protein CLU79DRAFT_836779 [Phycomyces nitens]|nr:hypothetical protein CLU79DRAFT_836779 [Phycomyces nitens]